MKEFIYPYLLFLAETATVVVALLLLLSSLFQMRQQQKKRFGEGEFSISCLNEEY